jgi:hypothetical protein
MKLFGRTTADNLAAARQSLAGAEAKILELEAVRAAKLPDADLAEVQRIDTDLATHRHAASIYRDRIASLIERQRQEERERLQAEKATSIANMTKRVVRRDAAGQRLETALVEMRSACAELLAADEEIAPGGSYLSITSLSPLCRRDRRHSDPAPRFVIGPIRAIADGVGADLAEDIRQKGLDLIAIMEAEPIAESVDENEDDDTEVAA